MVLAKPIYKAKVAVRLKESVLDPQGEAILRALQSQGESGYKAIRVGKLIELVLEGDDLTDVQKKVAKLADDLLANPIMETYAVTVESFS
ncbi:MAG: phosphoribosylformylglycinamidine synthase subunit PurS [Deltaproteobacteria bacterium]|nr:phosphoribosylformylglycinamidine synthase subunit PurS [Deltaproteobacteria bacterium]